jgi:hypothetical protein
VPAGQDAPVLKVVLAVVAVILRFMTGTPPAGNGLAVHRRAADSGLRVLGPHGAPGRRNRTRRR